MKKLRVLLVAIISCICLCSLYACSLSFGKVSKPKEYRLEIGMTQDGYSTAQTMETADGVVPVRTKFNNAVNSITVKKPNGDYIGYTINLKAKTVEYPELEGTDIPSVVEYPADCVIVEYYHYEDIRPVIGYETITEIEDGVEVNYEVEILADEAVSTKIVDDWWYYNGANQLSNNLLYDFGSEEGNHLDIYVEVGDVVVFDIVNFNYEGYIEKPDGSGNYETYKWYLRNLLINSSLYEDYYYDELKGQYGSDSYSDFDDLLNCFANEETAEEDGLLGYYDMTDGASDIIYSFTPRNTSKYVFSFEILDLNNSSDVYKIFLDYSSSKILKPIPYTDGELQLYVIHNNLSEIQGTVSFELLSKAQKDADSYLITDENKIPVPQEKYTAEDYEPEVVNPYLYNNSYGDIIQIVDETFDEDGELISTPVDYANVNENTVFYTKKTDTAGTVTYGRFEHYYGGGSLRRRYVKFGAKLTTLLGQNLEEKADTDLTYADLWAWKTEEFNSEDFVSNVPEYTKIDEGDKIRVNIQPKEGYYIKSVEITGLNKNTFTYDSTAVSDYVIQITEIKGVLDNNKDFVLVPETNLSMSGGYFDMWVGDGQSLPKISIMYALIDSFDAPTGSESSSLYSISVTNSANGTVTASTNSASAGTSVTLTVTPNSGYELDWLKVNGDTVTVTNSTYTFTLTQNTTVTYSFKAIQSAQATYTVTVSNGSNGTVTANKSSATEGTSITLTVTPNTGYELEWLKVNETSVTVTGNSYTFVLSQNTTVTYSFVAKTYWLTINYTGAPETVAQYRLQYAYGETYSVTSQSFTGYSVSQTIVSGTMGDADVTVEVTYTINQYPVTINYVYSTGGNASTAYTANVTYGTDFGPITSPAVDGYTADYATISGTMDSVNGKTYTVTYTANPTLSDVSYDNASLSDANFMNNSNDAHEAVTGYTNTVTGDQQRFVTNTSGTHVSGTNLFFEAEFKVTNNSNDGAESAAKLGINITSNNNWDGNVSFFYIDLAGTLGNSKSVGVATFTSSSWTSWDNPKEENVLGDYVNGFVTLAIYKQGANFTAYVGGVQVLTWTNSNLSGTAYINIRSFNTSYIIQNAKWATSNPYAGGNTGVLIANNLNATNFYYETYFDPVAITNTADAWVKGGIIVTITSTGESLYFYTDIGSHGSGSNESLADNNAFGLVYQSAGGSYNWTNDHRETVLSDSKVNSLDSNKYAVYKEGAYMYFLLNDEVIFATNNYSGLSGAVTVGIDGGNAMTYAYSASKYTTNSSNLATIKTMYKIGNEITVDGNLTEWGTKLNNYYGAQATDSSGKYFKAYAFMGEKAVYVAFEIKSSSYITTDTSGDWWLNTNVELRALDYSTTEQIYATAGGRSRNVIDYAISRSGDMTYVELVIAYNVTGKTAADSEMHLNFAACMVGDNVAGMNNGGSSTFWCGTVWADLQNTTFKTMADGLSETVYA